jgi:hypothetical protein
VTASDGAGLIVRDGDADLYVAVDRAAGRAKRSLARQIKHRRAHSSLLERWQQNISQRTTVYEE